MPAAWPTLLGDGRAIAAPGGRSPGARPPRRPDHGGIPRDRPRAGRGPAGPWLARGCPRSGCRPADGARGGLPAGPGPPARGRCDRRDGDGPGAGSAARHLAQPGPRDRQRGPAHGGRSHVGGGPGSVVARRGGQRARRADHDARGDPGHGRPRQRPHHRDVLGHGPDALAVDVGLRGQQGGCHAPRVARSPRSSRGRGCRSSRSVRAWCARR